MGHIYVAPNLSSSLTYLKQTYLHYNTIRDGPGSVQFLGLEAKPNHLFIIKTEPNYLKFMNSFKLNRLELSCLNKTV